MTPLMMPKKKPNHPPVTHLTAADRLEQKLRAYNAQGGICRMCNLPIALEDLGKMRDNSGKLWAVHKKVGPIRCR